MGRILTRTLAVGVLATLAVPVFADGAYAKGKPAKITLACDVGVSATGTVTLMTAALGTPVGNPIPVSCTSGQTSSVTVHPVSQPAAGYSFALALTGASSAGCLGGGTRGTGPVACGPSPTATLNVT